MSAVVFRVRRWAYSAIGVFVGGRFITIFLFLCAFQTEGLAQSITKRVAIKEGGEEQPNYFVEVGESVSEKILKIGVNGRTYSVYTGDSLLSIIDVRDYDGDGYRDAIIVNANTGNCCPFPYLFVSYRPPADIQVDEIGWYWKDPKIERYKGQWSVIGEEVSEGMENYKLETLEQRFVFEHGQATRVEQVPVREVDALVEVRSKELKDLDPGQTIKLSYDLNGDGSEEYFECERWARWGRMKCTLHDADGAVIDRELSNIACKRLGVLDARSNGMQDLVCDEGAIMRWDGKRYTSEDIGDVEGSSSEKGEPEWVRKLKSGNVAD